MGMDMYLYLAKAGTNLDESAHTYPYGYDSDSDDYYLQSDEVFELYYSRKFWDLFEAMPFTKGYECGAYQPLSREDIKAMLDYSCTHPDYWGDYTTVVTLCRILDRYDTWFKNGWRVYFECDW